jgi:hypothetical protein
MSDFRKEEESSFSEEKEAKRLLISGARPLVSRAFRGTHEANLDDHRRS